MRWHAGGGQFDLKRPTANLAFAKDCTACAVSPIWPDPETNWNGQVKAVFSVDQSGTVYGVELEGLTDSRVIAQMEEQVRAWTFKPGAASSERKSILIDVSCVDLMDAPAIGGCRLAPVKGPA
jgi:hypothetical protein